MGRAEGVVFALRPAGEAGEASALAQRLDAAAPAGQDLVRIGLVPDVPDHPVGRRVEHVVQGDGQLDHPQPRAQMAPGDRHGVDGGGAQFVRGLAQLVLAQPAKVGGRPDPVQQRGRFSHSGLGGPKGAGKA